MRGPPAADRAQRGQRLCDRRVRAGENRRLDEAIGDAQDRQQDDGGGQAACRTG